MPKSLVSFGHCLALLPSFGAVADEADVVQVTALGGSRDTISRTKQSTEVTGAKMAGRERVTNNGNNKEQQIITNNNDGNNKQSLANLQQ